MIRGCLDGAGAESGVGEMVEESTGAGETEKRGGDVPLRKTPNLKFDAGFEAVVSGDAEVAGELRSCWLHNSPAASLAP